MTTETVIDEARRILGREPDLSYLDEVDEYAPEELNPEMVGPINIVAGIGAYNQMADPTVQCTGCLQTPTNCTCCPT